MAQQKNLEIIAALAAIDTKDTPDTLLDIRGKISSYLLRPIEVPEFFAKLVGDSFEDLYGVEYHLSRKTIALIYLAVISSVSDTDFKSLTNKIADFVENHGVTIDGIFFYLGSNHPAGMMLDNLYQRIVFQEELQARANLPKEIAAIADLYL